MKKCKNCGCELRYIYNSSDKLKCEECGTEIDITIQPVLDDYFEIAEESTDSLIQDYFDEQDEELDIVNFYPSEEYEVFSERENGTKIIIVKCNANGEDFYGTIEVGFGIDGNGNEELSSYNDEIFIATQEPEEDKNKIHEIAQSMCNS